jgi:HTH-type transcriptional regulator / antitoxin HigA
MAKLTEYYPEEVYHPGETLKEKLEEMGMSIKEFALRTGKPEKTVIAVLNGSSSITSEMAILFENITKIPAYFWINKQARYNEYLARLKRKEAVDNAIDWARNFPYSEMAKYGWVPETRKIEEKAINLFEYFGIAGHEAWERLYIKSELKVAAYTSLKYTSDPYAISSWLRAGEIASAKIKAPVFDEKVFKSKFPDIKTLMAKHPANFFQKLQATCLEAGVKVFYTPKLPKAPISGSTRWISDSPVIQLSARYKQNDRFWFTFFHEAGHIILHGKKYISMEGIDFSGADPDKERGASRFAEEWTFSKKEEREVISNGRIDKEVIISYAKKFNTHPAIIVGRLQHLNKMHFSEGREFFEPVNLEVSSSNMVS